MLKDLGLPLLAVEKPLAVGCLNYGGGMSKNQGPSETSKGVVSLIRIGRYFCTLFHPPNRFDFDSPPLFLGGRTMTQVVKLITRFTIRSSCLVVLGSSESFSK